MKSQKVFLPEVKLDSNLYFNFLPSRIISNKSELIQKQSTISCQSVLVAVINVLEHEINHRH